MTIYTLFDGSEIELPDGLSSEEADNMIAKILPEKASAVGRTYDITKEYDLESGVDDLGLRFDLALAGSPEETKQFLNQKLGKDGWGISDFGQPYATPTGLRRLGKEPKDNRKVLLDGIANNLYDAVDLVPEIATGVAATAAELLIPVPGSGAVARGFLSSLGARQLAARSLYAGGGDFAATLGLEGVQALRGNQLESADEILTRAGTQGAAVAGISFGLGLPLTAIGPLTGKISETAKNRIKNTTTNNDIAVSAQSAIRARAEAKQALEKSGKYTKEEIEQILPIVTLRHQLGDEGNLMGKFASVLEGMGAKQKGSQIPAQALQFLEKIDGLWRAGETRGLPPHEIAALIKNSLTRSELSIARKGQDRLNKLYKKFGTNSKVQRDRAQLTDLLLANVDVQLKHGMRQFAGPKLYGNPKLQLDNLASIPVDNKVVANAINNIATTLKTTADDALRIMSTNSGELVGRLTNAVDIKQTPTGSVAVAKTANKTVDEAKKFPGFEKFAQEAAKFSDDKIGKVEKELTRVSAKDIYEIDRAFRNRVSTDSSISRNEIRQGIAASEQLVKVLDEVVSPTFSKEMKRVNGLYKKFITPFNKGLQKFETSTGQSVPQYVDDLVKGRKTDLFHELVDDLDAILSGIPEAGGRGKGVLTADEFLGEVAIQFMRGHRDFYELTNKNLRQMPISELRKNAAQALKQIDSLRKVESTPAFRKAFDRLFKNQAFSDYRKALQQVANGVPKGVDTLKTQLDFNQAATFIDGVSTLGNSLSGDSARFANAVDTVRQLKQLSPRSAELYNELLYAQIFERVLKIGGSEPAARNAGIKAWADDIVQANNINPEGLKELLGPYYKPITTMGNYMQGALNIDPTAGAISAAGQPLSAIRGLINQSLSAAVKPIVFLKVMTDFAPGGKAWKTMSLMTKKGMNEEQINKAMKPTMDAITKKAERSAALAIAGRDGLFAASIAGYLNEADDRLPPENTPVPKVVKRTPEQAAMDKQQGQQQQAAAPDLAMQQQELGANIMNMLQSASRLPPIGNIGESGLKEGAAIARAR